MELPAATEEEIQQLSSQVFEFPCHQFIFSYPFCLMQ
jgi:hypothetical protein